MWWAYSLHRTQTIHLRMIHTLEMLVRLTRNWPHMSAGHTTTHSSNMTHSCSCRKTRSRGHSSLSSHTPIPFLLRLHPPPLHPNPIPARPNLRPSPSRA